jgi:hypothetical protein
MYKSINIKLFNKRVSLKGNSKKIGTYKKNKETLKMFLIKKNEKKKEVSKETYRLQSLDTQSKPSVMKKKNTFRNILS